MESSGFYSNMFICHIYIMYIYVHTPLRNIHASPCMQFPCTHFERNVYNNKSISATFHFIQIHSNFTLSIHLNKHEFRLCGVMVLNTHNKVPTFIRQPNSFFFPCFRIQIVMFKQQSRTETIGKILIILRMNSMRLALFFHSI